MQLIQQVWQTTYGGFRNASQNYSQLALAAFCSFDNIVMQPTDSVYLIEGDKMFNSYVQCKCAPYDECNFLQGCIQKYENDLKEGVIPFDYFITKVKTVETELAGLTPFKYPYNEDHINDIGFHLLKTRNAEEAYKLFKHYEVLNPGSWTVYQGLGDASRQMGNKEKAIDYYKKSLKLNPENQDVMRVMARLNGK